MELSSDGHLPGLRARAARDVAPERRPLLTSHASSSSSPYEPERASGGACEGGTRRPQLRVHRHGAEQDDDEAQNGAMRETAIFENADEAVEEGTAVFQFSTGVFYAEEEEGHVIVDIMRIGETSQRVHVDYRTTSGSAVTEEHFTGAAGSITFEEGECVKSLSIRLTQSDVWQPPLDFSVELDNPSEGSVVNPSSSLSRCRVWILVRAPATEHMQGAARAAALRANSLRA